MIILLQLYETSFELGNIEPYKLKRCFPLSGVPLYKSVHLGLNNPDLIRDFIYDHIISLQNYAKTFNVKKHKI